VICVRQVSERAAHYFAERCRRLRNDIGDLPIRARALRVQSPDCDELDFAAAEGPNAACRTLTALPLRFAFPLHSSFILTVAFGASLTPGA
jgi:hypothetical protein